MRLFDFETEYKKLLTPTIVGYLSQIHEFKGIQTGMNLQEEMLSELVEIAKIQSTEASNRIEGIITTDDRLKKLIYDTKDSYYEALQASSYGWHENENNYAPFVEYMLGIVIAAYRDFTARAKLLTEKGVSKPKRVRDTIKNTTGKITKSEIMEKCPDISQTTVQRALNDLLKSEEIIKIGGGRYTSYIWNWEKE